MYFGASVNPLLSNRSPFLSGLGKLITSHFWGDPLFCEERLQDINLPKLCLLTLIFHTKTSQWALLTSPPFSMFYLHPLLQIPPDQWLLSCVGVANFTSLIKFLNSWHLCRISHLDLDYEINKIIILEFGLHKPFLVLSKFRYLTHGPFVWPFSRLHCLQSSSFLHSWMTDCIFDDLAYSIFWTNNS